MSISSLQVKTLRGSGAYMSMTGTCGGNMSLFRSDLYINS